jgi:GNAT superfamily N-acetyltransferase
MAGPAAPEFQVEPLDSQHDREGFFCGVASLDAYLKTQASQDMRRKANAVFVLVAPPETARILGYFTLCAFALGQGDVPDEARRHIPRYPLVSATLIGRLAVARDRQGQGIGGILLAVALRKAYENAAIVGSSMVVVDALDDRAIRFYEAHGFTKLPDSLWLVLPMRSVSEMAGPRWSR